MKHYWIAIANQDQVLRSVTGGFIQAPHGRQSLLQKLRPGDLVLYYSPTKELSSTVPLRRFTALAKVQDSESYQVRISTDFSVWRRNVSYLTTHETPVEPLINQLAFIINKRRWAIYLRRGIFLIPGQDFHLIAAQMGVTTL